MRGAKKAIVAKSLDQMEYEIQHVQHTGRVQVASASGPRFWFLRPNGEVFEMYFDNPPEVFRLGLTLDDITYTDDNADIRHLARSVNVPTGTFSEELF